MLALLVAVCFAAAWVLRLGWIADYFSRPVLIGYIHGVAVVLVIGQLGKLLGLSIDAMDPLPQLWEVITELGSVSGATVAVSVVSLAALFGLRLLMPKLPAALLIVVAAIGLSWAFDFAAHGIAVVGPIPAGLPSFAIPTPGLRRRRPAAAGGARDLPRLLRGRDPHGAVVRRQAPPERAGIPGAAGDGCCERRGRVHAGLPDRGERLAHRGQRRHGRAQPDRRASSQPRPWP